MVKRYREGVGTGFSGVFEGTGIVFGQIVDRILQFLIIFYY